MKRLFITALLAVCMTASAYAAVNIGTETDGFIVGSERLGWIKYAIVTIEGSRILLIKTPEGVAMKDFPRPKPVKGNYCSNCHGR